VTKYEDEPAAPRDASRDLERIRALMERATEYSHLSGVSVLLSGLLSVAGVAACAVLGLDFRRVAADDSYFRQASPQRGLAVVWGSVFVLAAVQGVAFSVANARRRAEPAWSPLTRQVVAAMLPALFTGAALTAYALQSGQIDLLPPCWMLAYGSSLMGLGLFAGTRIRWTALVFLILGAATLFAARDHGLIALLASFGGLHLFLGAWMLWKPRV
jgi:hypothetical protein